MATKKASRAEGDYIPPTTEGLDPENIGVPQDNSDAVLIEDEGGSPHTPPENTATITDPGGSPTRESGMQPEEPPVEPEEPPVEPEEPPVARKRS